MDTTPGAEQFATLARGADPDLGRCCLAIGRISQPELDPAPYLATLADYAQRVRARTAAGGGDQPNSEAAPERIAAAVCAVLFEEAGFRGDRDDYYDPANSYLHRVLERRRGLPITLSILVIEVGRRAGLAVEGVGTPGHFLIKFRAGREERFLDAFNEGRAVSREAVARGLEATAGRGGLSAEAFLSAVTARQMLGRVLANLKGAHLRRQEFRQALGAAQYHLAMNPWALDELRDRGLLQFELHQYDEALRDLRQYRAHAGEAADAERIDALIARIEGRGSGADGEAG